MTSQKSRTVVIGAAALVVLAAFLPWVSVLGFTRSGIDGDGLFTLALGAAGLLLVWRQRFGWLGQIVPAGLVALIGRQLRSDRALPDIPRRRRLGDRRPRHPHRY